MRLPAFSVWDRLLLLLLACDESGSPHRTAVAGPEPAHRSGRGERSRTEPVIWFSVRGQGRRRTPHCHDSEQLLNTHTASLCLSFTHINTHKRQRSKVLDLSLVGQTSPLVCLRSTTPGRACDRQRSHMRASPLAKNVHRIHGCRFPKVCEGHGALQLNGPGLSKRLTCRNLAWEEGRHFRDGSTIHYWSTRDKNTPFKGLKEELESFPSPLERRVPSCFSMRLVESRRSPSNHVLSLTLCLWLIFPQLSLGLRCVTFHPACRSKYSFHRKQTSASREQAHESVCIYACE